MLNRRLYPFASHHHNRGGLRLHYLDEGHGDPVVMVHGNPTWSFFYRDVVRALAPTHRCIVPDHIGCGLSEKPQPPRYGYSLAERVDDLKALLDALDIRQRVTLVVHDWGGMIGLAWAVRHAVAIERLVILNTAGFPLPATKPLPLALRLGRNSWLGEWLIRGLNAFCYGTVLIGTKRAPLPNPVARMYLEPYRDWASRVAVARFVQTIPLAPSDAGYDIVQEVATGLEQFRNTPVFIGWGLRDFVFDAHFLAEWRRRLPHAEVHAHADAGHYLLDDVPELVPQIAGFVRGQTSGTP